ncbi:MAG: thiamine-phosphate kinase [Planctomycetota bacterium]
MNEFEIIDWLRTAMAVRGPTVVGPGDDCALVRMDGGDLCVSVDAIVEGVDFLPGTKPYAIGWKAAAAGLSDIAAAGCAPVAVVAAVMLPPGRGLEFVQDLHRGMDAVCLKFGISVAGGDLSATGDRLVVTVTAFGRVPPGVPMLRRCGARDGDRLFVTGTLGGSIEGRQFTFLPRIREVLRIRDIAAPTAMIDISDGLWSEANHIARESGLTITIDAPAIPVADEVRARHPDDAVLQWRHALTDGEDFELLFTLPAAAVDNLLRKWDFKTPLTCIGVCRAGAPAVELAGTGGRLAAADLRSYSHAF